MSSRVLRAVGLILVATAGCYLAYLAAALGVWLSSSLLLGALGKVKLYGFRASWAMPWVMTGFPRDGSAALYALHQGGAVVFGAAFLALALAALRWARGWLRLWTIYVVLWSSLWYALLLSGLAGPGAGGVGAALRVLWPARADAMTAYLRVLGAGVALAAAYFAARGLAGGSRWVRVQWVLPLAIVGLFLSRFFRPGWPWTALLYGPALLALLFSLHGVGEPLRAGAPGAAVIVAAFALACGGIYSYPNLIRWFRGVDFVSRQSSYWRLHFEKGGFPEARQTELAAACDQRLAALAARLGIAPPNPTLEAFFYASTERKIAAVGSDAGYTVNGRDVHLLVMNFDPRGDALALLNRVWGKPASEPVARAIARYAAGDFYGSPLAAYAARITREEGPYPLAEVFEQNAAYLSPLVRDALGGAWVQMQIERRGTEVLPRLYRNRVSATELEGEWNAWQLENERRFPPGAPKPRSAPAFQRGITLSHEYGAAFGYGSDRAFRQFGRLRELGANAVAVVPYAGTPGRGAPRLQPLGGETDDRVIRTIRAAHELGLAVTLKPQIWSGVFTGDIVFPREDDFERWFGAYRGWLLHYARLAELFNVELLVIGNELGGLTGREAAWRSLIRDLRRVYSGPLTYAASWGPEFEELAFWSALDYIGVNMYYPLAAPGEAPDAGSGRVREVAEKIAAVARKYSRPVLFTEIGYPARSTAAARPWDSADRSLDPELQKRCYEVAFEAFYRQPWLAGLYWWKWPSHGDGHRFDNSFSPIGKPAEEVLARWYLGSGQDASRKDAKDAKTAKME